MSSQLPIVRQIAWISVLPQLAILIGIIAICRRLNAERFVLLAALLYLAISVGVRNALTRHHRRGMHLFKEERFADAIPCFERSYSFFTAHSWIDKWRYLILLSSSRISYREMALLNTAFCYAQIGNGSKSLELYERTLHEFPGSKLAETALRLLRSAKGVA